MSVASDAFEHEIVTMVSKHIGEELPATLPDWMIKRRNCSQRYNSNRKEELQWH